MNLHYFPDSKLLLSALRVRRMLLAGTSAIGGALTQMLNGRAEMLNVKKG